MSGGEITTHFGVVKDAGHELSQKITTLHTYFQVRQTPAGSAMVDMKINCAMLVAANAKSSAKNRCCKKKYLCSLIGRSIFMPLIRKLSQKMTFLHTYFQVRQNPLGSIMVDMTINCARLVAANAKSSAKNRCCKKKYLYR